MSINSFPLPPLPLNRRELLIGGVSATAGLLLPSLAGAQTKLVIPEGNVAPLPIAIPNFVPGSPEPEGLSLQHRDRAARDRRQFPRRVVRSALLARRPAHRHEPAAGWQCQPVRDGPAFEGDHAAHRHARDRYLAVLFAGREPDLF